MNSSVFRRTLCLFLLFSVAVMSGCDRTQQPKGFVKLEKSLRQTFPEIRFRVINLSGDSSDEVVFQGLGVTIEDDYIPMNRHTYTLYTSQAVETNRYIFVPIAAHGGGRGVFWALNVVDKKTLITADEVSLGDRVRIIEVFELDSHPDAVGISYIRRDVKSEVIYNPSKTITEHFQMREGTLEEITVP